MQRKNFNFPKSSSKAQIFSASMAVGAIPSLKEPQVLDRWIIWLEQLPEEGGRTSAFIRPWGKPEVAPQELTPSPINLRTKVHVYGGSPLASINNADNLLITWIDALDGCLWFQSFRGLLSVINGCDPCLIASTKPIRLSEPANYKLADGLIDLSRRRWVGVMEEKDKDCLVSFSIDKENQSPKIIYEAEDFLGYASLSPNNEQLIWVEWQRPNMPWISSQLLLGSFDRTGKLKDNHIIAGSRQNDGKKVSISQPLWFQDKYIIFADDSSGWWNLKIIRNLDQSFKINDLVSLNSECAEPQWIYGMSTLSVAGDKILFLSCSKGIWNLNSVNLFGEIETINQPFQQLEYLNCSENKVVVVASGPESFSGLLEVDLNNNKWKHSEIVNNFLNQDTISIPNSFWFNGSGDEPTHSWYYPAKENILDATPLLLKIHSGPTSMASNGLNPWIQFWTSRGWSVLDVNYGGSSGFGRCYRDRLQSSWGITDVFDCIAAIEAIVKQEKIDKNLIAVEGGSAGGFTALLCLSYSKLFKVAACRYPVTDLLAMQQETHRFESGYLDYLLGINSNDIDELKVRSPINRVNTINTPVIFFQGLMDKVVSFRQTNLMYESLLKKQIPVEFYSYENEGHGFRDPKVKTQVLELTEKFFRKHLKI